MIFIQYVYKVLASVNLRWHAFVEESAKMIEIIFPSSRYFIDPFSNI